MIRLPFPLAPAVLFTLGLLLAAPGAHASLGPFEHGAGIKAMGAGGIAYIGAQETTALSANPSQALALGSRYDLGLDLLHIHPDARIEGNALGPDERYSSDGRNWYPIPQAGIARPLGERWAWGLTILEAGVGPDYPESPYSRFGGARRASLALGSANLASALAYRLTDRQVIGAGLVLGYEVLDIKGLQFLASSDPQFRVSEHPDKVTNQGKEGAFSIGFTLGWTGYLTPQLSAGIGYRSKSWTQKLDDYRGLLPDGKLELPAVFGGGLAWKPLPGWMVAIEWQHYAFASEAAFGNSISTLSEGKALGSSDGPGFGLDDQDAFKFGITWKARPGFDLRLGYVHATQMIQHSDTLFPLMAPVAMTTHYTTGATWIREKWEITGGYTYAPRNEIHGHNSIPPAFGGGEASVSTGFASFALTVGRRF